MDQLNGLGSGTCGINAINSAVFIRNCIFNNNRIGIYAGPVSLVAGDQVGIRVETDAATAAVSATAQISIRKLP